VAEGGGLLSRRLVCRRVIRCTKKRAFSGPLPVCWLRFNAGCTVPSQAVGSKNGSKTGKAHLQRYMQEFKQGEIKTAGGTRKVRNRTQAAVIALSEADTSKYDKPSEGDATCAARPRSAGGNQSGGGRRAPTHCTAPIG
jgi:hypothetical protein